MRNTYQRQRRKAAEKENITPPELQALSRTGPQVDERSVTPKLLLLREVVPQTRRLLPLLSLSGCPQPLPGLAERLDCAAAVLLRTRSQRVSIRLLTVRGERQRSDKACSSAGEVRRSGRAEGAATEAARHLQRRRGRWPQGARGSSALNASWLRRNEAYCLSILALRNARFACTGFLISRAQ